VDEGEEGGGVVGWFTELGWEGAMRYDILIWMLVVGFIMTENGQWVWICCIKCSISMMSRYSYIILVTLLYCTYVVGCFVVLNMPTVICPPRYECLDISALI
jgi:hypothetical protein